MVFVVVWGISDTSAVLIKLGYATGKVLLANQAAPNENHRPNVVIGKDTRLSGYVIEACLQAGFNAAGWMCIC